jgi:hypothetical protein
MNQTMWLLVIMTVENDSSTLASFNATQLAPDFGPRGPRFETRAWRIFHDLGKVSEY